MAIGRRAYTQPQTGSHGHARDKKVLGGAYTILAADVALNNSVAIMLVPKDFVVTSIFGTMPDLDSGGAPTATAGIGDAANLGRLVATSDVGVKTGAAVPAIVAGSVGFRYTADTEILLTISAAAQTPAGGSGSFFMEGYVGP